MRTELVASSPDILQAHQSVGGLTAAEKAATEWVLGMRSLMDGVRFINSFVHFEKLVRDPETSLAEVLSNCELDMSDRVLQLARSATSSRLRTEPADFGIMSKLIEQTRRELGV
jgi:hypothetical protein